MLQRPPALAFPQDSDCNKAPSSRNRTRNLRKKLNRFHPAKEGRQSWRFLRRCAPHTCDVPRRTRSIHRSTTPKPRRPWRNDAPAHPPAAPLALRAQLDRFRSVELLHARPHKARLVARYDAIELSSLCSTSNKPVFKVRPIRDKRQPNKLDIAAAQLKCFAKKSDSPPSGDLRPIMPLINEADILKARRQCIKPTGALAHDKTKRRRASSCAGRSTLKKSMMTFVSSSSPRVTLL